MKESEWILKVNDASQLKGYRLGIYLKSSTLPLVQQVIRCKFSTTNNEVEYEAFIAGLKVAYLVRAKKIRIKSDSQLIVNQVNKGY